MASHIKITPIAGPVTVRAGTTLLGATQNALQMAEGSYPPVTYVPRADMAMAMLTKTTRQTSCPHKGACSYYSITTPAGVLENVVWSYETPIAGMEPIAGHLAFYTDQVSVIL